MIQTLDIKLAVKGLSSRQFEGHGSMFRNVDVGGDVVVPGAFKRTLAKHQAEGSMPLMFWMHNPEKVPGRWLEMREDGDGLYVKGELAKTPLGEEIHELVKMEAVRGLSIGYRVIDQDFDKDGNRLLKEIDLWEVSPVSMPMNPKARVEAAKALLSGIGTKRELERFLRDAGTSRKEAMTIVASIYDDADISETLDAQPQRDAVDVDPELAEALKALDRLTGMTVAEAFRR